MTNSQLTNLLLVGAGFGVGFGCLSYVFAYAWASVYEVYQDVGGRWH